MSFDLGKEIARMRNAMNNENDMQTIQKYILAS